MTTTRTLEIADLVQITRRKTDGSVCFIKAKVSDGASVVAFQSSGQLTDAPEHVLVIEGDRLTIGGKHLSSYEATLAVASDNAARTAARDAEMAILDADAVALLPTLPAIVGKSDRQAEWATTVRETRFVLSMRACTRLVASRPDTAGIVELIREELRTNASARFWLDVAYDGDGGFDPGHALDRVVRHMRAEGRSPDHAA